MTQRRWTAEEDEILRTSYGTGGIAAASVALPERSHMAILLRANRQGIASPRYWTEKDDDQLRWLWGSGNTLPRIAAKLGRTGIACYERARDIGLKCGCPQGSEYVTNAAIRAGVSTVKLRSILERHGVAISRSLSRPYRRGNKCEWANWRHHVVDPHDVDEAIAAWVRES